MPRRRALPAPTRTADAPPPRGLAVAEGRGFSSDNALRAFLVHLAEDTRLGERSAQLYLGHLRRFAAWLAEQPWRERLWEPIGPKADDGEDYGLGFFVLGPVVFAFGAFWGISAHLSLDRSSGLIVAALANADPTMAEDAAAALAASAAAA